MLLTCLTASQYNTAVEGASATIISYGEREKKLSFNVAHQKTENLLGVSITYPDFEIVLAEVNRRSFKAKGVLLSVIVLCNHGLPGMKLYRQMVDFRLLISLPDEDDLFTRRAIAKQHQQKVFEAYKLQIVVTGTQRPDRPTPPILF